jgi:hypothetical protein
MGNLYIKVETLAGMSLEDAFDEAKDLSRRTGCSLELVFNGISLHVTANTTDDKVSEEYKQQMGMQRSVVRP